MPRFACRLENKPTTEKILDAAADAREALGAYGWMVDPPLDTLVMVEVRSLDESDWALHRLQCSRIKYHGGRIAGLMIATEQVRPQRPPALDV